MTVNDTTASTNLKDGMRVALHRLNPHLNARRGATSMFDQAACLDLRLIKGSRWGDDYLVAPDCSEQRRLVEGLMRVDGIYFEPDDELPIELRCQL